MKTCFKILIAFGFVTTSVFAGESKKDSQTEKGRASERQVQLDLASVSSKLIATIKLKQNEALKDHKFQNIVDCDAPGMENPLLEFTGKCFEFLTGKASSVLQVPVVVVNATGEKAYSTVNKANRTSAQDLEWGSLSYWDTPTKGSATYIFLAPKDKEAIVRVGPIPSSILKNYDIQWKIESW